MKLLIERNKNNPIVTGGKEKYRKVGTFNPGVIYDNGKFFMIDRGIQSIRPLICTFSLLESEDGVHFSLTDGNPIFSAQKDLGCELGTVEDPRIVKIENTFYMTFAHRPYTYDCHPNGLGVPEYRPLKGELDKGINHTLSGFAVSDDLRHFEIVSMLNAQGDIDERDVILFPERINGKFAVLRRPRDQHGEEYGTSGPSIWISYSDDLKSFTDPELVAGPLNDWEGEKIGSGAPPLKTKEGWLLLYHGVDKDSVYKVGAMLLDLNDPRKVLYRTKNPIMVPEYYYEKFGLIIPNVIFPTACLEKDGLLYIYYGCCDTSISLATVKLDNILKYLKLGD